MAQLQHASPLTESVLNWWHFFKSKNVQWLTLKSIVSRIGLNDILVAFDEAQTLHSTMPHHFLSDKATSKITFDSLSRHEHARSVLNPIAHALSGLFIGHGILLGTSLRLAQVIPQVKSAVDKVESKLQVFTDFPPLSVGQVEKLLVKRCPFLYHYDIGGLQRLAGVLTGIVMLLGTMLSVILYCTCHFRSRTFHHEILR